MDAVFIFIIYDFFARRVQAARRRRRRQAPAAQAEVARDVAAEVARKVVGGEFD